MMICPNCSSSYLQNGGSTCGSCGWKRRDIHGIGEYLSLSDRNSGMFDNYTENYEELAQKNLEQSNIDRRFLHNQAKNLAKYLGLLDGKYVCDIGIGQGFLCDELLKAGVEKIAAIDVAISFLMKFADSDQVMPYLANAESLPFKDEFDVITSTDVMEHVLNVGSFLYCVNRALKMRGLAAIRVPYREGLLEYSPHRNYKHEFGHMRSFNKDILRTYMKQAGFEVIAFHLDGFSLGTPHPWLYSTPKRKEWYHKFYAYWDMRLEHPADAALMNPKFAGMFMRPVEIVVVGEKTRELSALGDN